VAADTVLGVELITERLLIAESNVLYRDLDTLSRCIAKRTSPQVHVKDEERVMTHLEVFFSAALMAIEALAIALVLTALLWNAPLEGLANPMHTPNAAKAPWYFLGLQEMLHYFPPVGASVLVPGLVVIALIVIPYFNITVEAEGIWPKGRARLVRVFGIVVMLRRIFLAVFQVGVALVPTLIIIAPPMYGAASQVEPGTATGFRRSLVHGPLSYWIMTWFVFRTHRTHRDWTFFPGRDGHGCCPGRVHCNEGQTATSRGSSSQIARAFGSASLILLVLLAIAPPKNHFNQSLAAPLAIAKAAATTVAEARNTTEQSRRPQSGARCHLARWLPAMPHHQAAGRYFNPAR
jgi:hypothetical protein